MPAAAANTAFGVVNASPLSAMHPHISSTDPPTIAGKAIAFPIVFRRSSARIASIACFIVRRIRSPARTQLSHSIAAKRIIAVRRIRLGRTPGCSVPTVGSSFPTLIVSSGIAVPSRSIRISGYSPSGISTAQYSAPSEHWADTLCVSSYGPSSGG